MAETTTIDGIPVKSALAVAVSMAVAGHADDAKAQEGAAKERGLEEITVTARKREQSLQDVSASIQALTGDDLKRQGLLNLEDTIRMIPSMSSIGATAGANKIIFRGVSDNPVAFIAASSAALYIDEQPLTQFSINPEPRMIDIERVEALAGPQGTLYGDSSQSGTLKIVTNKPDPTAFSASADFMLRTGDESDASHEVSGVLNLPLVEDKFALRLVGFTATDGGFIDNVLGASPQQGTKDNSNTVGDNINDVDTTGGRIAAKWFVNDNWSATFNLMSQKSEAGARNDYDPLVGDLKTVKFFRDTRDDDWIQGALTIEGKIGELDFISITSYFDRDINYIYDRTAYSAYFNYNFCPQYATYCWSGQSGADNHAFGAGPISVDDNGYLTFYSTVPNDQDTVGFNTLDQKNKRKTQEFRLSQTGENYRWVLGAFYEEKSEYWEYRARTPEFESSLSYAYWTYLYSASGVDPSWWLSVDDTEWDQWAVFGNFSYDFNDQFSAELGVRVFDQEQNRFYYVAKPFIVRDISSTSPKGGNDDVVPKLTLTYRIDDEKMLYALYSEGWRAGGANRNRTPFTAIPQVYEPDLLKNFEVGAKTRWLDNKLQVNGTIYFGQWENYQIEVLDPSFQPCDPGEVPDIDFCSQPFQIMVANVGDAEQFGVELDIRAAPNDNLDLGINLGYVNAETAEELVVTQPVPKGTQLPNVPELKFNGFVQYTWPVMQGESMFVRGQYSWQDDSRNQLEEFPYEPGLSAAATFIQPSYGIFDLKVGLNSDQWSLEAFVNNVSDERATLFDDPFFFDTFFGRRRVTTNRPREFGVRFAYNWN
ncbi:MAG: TonB-dependent receptor [Gammaproteobacteria bacterium]|nr:TonB-dependent receptor [Gammaproteobacteria bacterium]MBU2676052.1 TonB-dependent receptor [Gammaproteobacteria bacterium]NNC57155.1 TonB-dependent receptor [Woeseiaceae bacterium]NNL49788.1 TonB-dependent receptor [Woeseiaceae bacterium]